MISKLFYLLSEKTKKKIFFLSFIILINLVIEICSLSLIYPLIKFIAEGIIEIKILSLNILITDSPTLKIANILIMLLGIIFLIKFLVNMTLLIFSTNFAFETARKLQQKFLNLYLHQPYIYFVNKDTSKIITNIKEDIKIYTDKVLLSAAKLIPEILNIFGFVVILLFVDILVTGIILFFIVASVFLFYFFFKNKLKFYGSIRLDLDSKILNNLYLTLSSIRESKIYFQSDLFYSEFCKLNKLLTKVLKKLEIFSDSPRYILEIIFVFSMLLGLYILSEKNLLNNTLFPVIGIFIAAAFKIIPSINRILTSMQSIRVGMVSMYHLIDEFNKLNKNYEIILSIKQKNNKKSILERAINIENLSFTYQSSQKFVFKNLNFQIKKNSLFGISGKSGTGKSTLINLLIGFLKPTSGKIFLDKKNLCKYRNEWFKNIGLIPQKVFLSNNSILENITFTKNLKDVDQKKLEESLLFSQSENFINNLQKKILTKVGEDGLKFSGGQIQRIALARAIYHDREVLFFDEFTSALDEENESKILNTILNLRKKKTIILITHKKKILNMCDDQLLLSPLS